MQECFFSAGVMLAIQSSSSVYCEREGTISAGAKQHTDSSSRLNGEEKNLYIERPVGLLDALPRRCLPRIASCHNILVQRPSSLLFFSFSLIFSLSSSGWFTSRYVIRLTITERTNTQAGTEAPTFNFRAKRNVRIISNAKLCQ